MIKARIFPRYNVKSLPLTVELSTKVSHSIKIQDISLTGLNIFTKNAKLISSPNLSLTLCLKEKNYFLRCNIIWRKKEEQGDTIGVKFQFQNLRELEHWKTFIKAISQLATKRVELCHK